MFLDSSRYAKVKTIDVTTSDGRTNTAVKLRRLPSPTGKPTGVKGYDRLDVMAQRNYKDGTLFWHIADANSELQARALVEELNRTIMVPEE